MMQDMNATLNNCLANSPKSIFDASVNGHDYLRSIIQLPVYLQLDRGRKKQQKLTDDGFPKRRHNVSIT